MSESTAWPAAAGALDPFIRAHADEAETLRRLPPATVEALRDAGMFRLCVPGVYGGPELDPVTLLDTLATLAVADGAAGWCAMIASTTSSLACFLPAEGARQLFSDPSLISGGAAAPSGQATTAEGGWVVEGRWAWGSGTDHCDWIVGGATTDTGEYRLMFMPAASVTSLDTWHSSGLRGSGSTDFAAAGAFVPTELTTRPGVGSPTCDSPLARFPNFTLLAACVAATMLGIARRAVEEITVLATEKRPAFARRTLATSALTQVDVARADGAVRAGRAWLGEEVSAAWQTVLNGDRVSLAQRARVRSAAVYAAEESVRAVDLSYHLGGGSSVYSSNPLQRCLRDIHVASQHIQVSRRTLETVGQIHLGLEAETSLF